MAHLIPIRRLLQAIAIAVGLALLVAVYGGAIGNGDGLRDASTTIRIATMVSAIAVGVLWVSWRWFPPLQRSIFPYLGGFWAGVIEFGSDDSLEQRSVNLEVKHTLLSLKFLLESAESTSWTLVVHANKDADFNRCRVYYVYLNERKEGVLGAGERYRGLAVLRVEHGRRLSLLGNYFTETNRRGTLRLSRRNAHPWWKLWC